MVDENPAHGLCGDPKEVAPVLPLHATLIDELQVSLVNQGRCGDGVIRLLAPQIRFRQLFELGVHNLDQLTLGNLVAPTPRYEQLCNVHRRVMTA